MKTLYIVTGANGHLGSTIIRILRRQHKQVRGLILDGEDCRDGQYVRYLHGDVRSKASLEPLFADIQAARVTVIHTAGIVDIADKASEQMVEVNVRGTQNMVELCLKHRVARLVYVSSVHAIPEKDDMQVLEEVGRFSSSAVVGGYAKTKAAATQIVLDAVKEGLDAVVVHPSGILGPYDESGNHLVQLVKSYVQGRLPACVRGGYDFVDVRDVAAGCLTAAEKGKTGECYILSNRHYEIKDLLRMVRTVQGGRKIPTLPVWMAKAAAPIIEWRARNQRSKPLFTRYSLYTLTSNDRFSHDKATRELGYRPRDLYETIRDTVRWMQSHNPSAAPSA
ncbi:NAD-dependent epimerase/dehydratase family protein [Candidatus Soleaferrea massiliensis]|uniref:NAD-dependent epimerase/dehydratase family protein n=1 Tax=Candidatus Soleaferrea massiliensis TaxID=1470354 RepID=UPI00058E8820|nr:NAD-dependent epimerase/dehydratase family protein [Candidatus Soleaferrea massiliensis]